MKENIGVRDVAAFSEWWASRFGTSAATKSAWARHRAGSHYEVRPDIQREDGTPLDLDTLVDDLFAAWLKANKGITPSAKELREWLKLRASIRADLESRKNAGVLEAMLLDAGHKPKEVTDAVQVPRRVEGNQP